MSEINGYVSDETIELILAGVIEGVQPTTQEVAMARELRALRKILDGVPQEAIDGGWTARGLSDYAKQLETELAAMREKAEPVAYRYRFRPTSEAAGKWILVETIEEANPLPKYEIQPLYTAPPAPVVADALEHLRSIVADPRALPRRKLWISGQQYSYVLLENVEAMVDEACRAAMLAAPGKQPLSVDVLAGVLRNAPLASSDNQGRQLAPIADGWIACSERFPEVGDIVLTADHGCVNVGEMERSGSGYRYFTSVVSGRELPASHWMPLPEAPGKN